MAASRSLVVALVVAPLVALLVALLGSVGVRPCDAEGATLTGLLAPELTFPTGLNGVARGQTLSAYRGKVVWLKFWLRDCPRCRKTLPLAQELHELYGKSGLVVLTVVHQFAPDQVRPFLEKEGYTFPVACDPTGALAQAYQVNHRPTDYVIGVDGRVKVSNGGPEDMLHDELARYRVAELGRVPVGLESVRDEVRAWRYGPALKQAAAAAAANEAPAEVRDFAARLDGLAARKLDEDVERGNVLLRRKRPDEARLLLEALATGHAGTVLAAKAEAALEAFRAAAGG